MAVEQPDDGGLAADDAEEFLEDILKGGPVSTKEIKEAANAHGHSWRTVNRAKAELGVKAVKGGFNEGWSWRLPEPLKNANGRDEGCQQD
jgi:hypothetical protein